MDAPPAQDHDSPELEAEIEVLSSEIAFYFPDPADVFEDVLARLLGLDRPDGISENEWRRMRVAYIREREDQADRLSLKAASAVDEVLKQRARQWSYRE